MEKCLSVGSISLVPAELLHQGRWDRTLRTASLLCFQWLFKGQLTFPKFKTHFYGNCEARRMIWKSLIKYLTATKRTAIEQSRMVRGTLAHPKCRWNGGCIHYSPVSLHALCSPWWCWAACCAPPVTVSSHHGCWCWEAIWANWNREIKMGWGGLHWAGLVSKPVFTLSCFCDHFVFPPVQVRLVGEVLQRLKSFFAHW